MFHVTVLGSGSGGNSTLVETPAGRLLLDAGLSARQTIKRLVDLGVDPGRIDGILLTHEHGDHVQALPVLCRKLRLPIYCNPATADVLRDSLAGADWRLFETGSTLEIAGLAIETFSVPHDAADPVGYLLDDGGAALALLTDLGYATRLVRERVRGAHTVIIETNHDERLLQLDTRRPWSVKQRILSRHGHLSNTAAAEVLAESLSGSLRRVITGHLSRDCNTPELAVETVRARLAKEGLDALEIFASLQHEPSRRCAVG